MKALLNVVVVTYKNRMLIEKCIASVYESLAHADIEGIVTVVDNASRDGTRELVVRSFPKVNYIENGENLGLAKSLNIGIRSVQGALYTLLLNDDVELFPDTISLMLKTLGEHPRAQAIPASLIRPDGSLQRMKMSIIWLSNRRIDRVREIGFGGTTACMYRTEVFSTVGLFDEFYFFYNEDLDFTLRAKRKGIKFVFNPEARVVHLKCQGRKKGERYVRPHFYATNYYFYRKNYGLLAATLFLAVALVQIHLLTRKLRKEGKSDRLLLLEQGRDKLIKTVRNFDKTAVKTVA